MANMVWLQMVHSEFHNSYDLDLNFINKMFALNFGQQEKSENVLLSNYLQLLLWLAYFRTGWNIFTRKVTL